MEFEYTLDEIMVAFESSREEDDGFLKGKYQDALEYYASLFDDPLDY